MNIKGLNKAQVLAALYNHASSLGSGFMLRDPAPMTVEEAQSLLDGGQTNFDYLRGRVMKIDLREDEVETWLYNRDNGEGAAEKVIAGLGKK